ncbi:MAG: 50S ribosomal protein L31 [Myxococcales bacterium]|nr:50S ribosomal protein L31 [Myxococcales bacterium]
MRQVHPYYPACTITCACGVSYPTRSTRGDFSVDVCGQCHPFYTGKQKLMDTAGRVDRFRKKFGEGKAVVKPGKDPAAQGQKLPKKAKEKKAAPAAAAAEAPAAEPVAEG